MIGRSGEGCSQKALNFILLDSVFPHRFLFFVKKMEVFFAIYSLGYHSLESDDLVTIAEFMKHIRHYDCFIQLMEHEVRGSGKWLEL